MSSTFTIDTTSSLPPLISPAPTPGASSPKLLSDSASSSPPLPSLQPLPKVQCQVRARIPTTYSYSSTQSLPPSPSLAKRSNNNEMYLHLYHNDFDNKEHLAIVFGPHIRSKSLDEPRIGETERDRMIRGAYKGRLWPGRTSSSLGKETNDNKRKKEDRKVDVTKEENGQSQVSGDTIENDVNGRESHQLASPLVRIHSECYTGETVWSARCDCGEQLDEAARLMTDLNTSLDHDDNNDGEDLPSLGGVIIYLRQEGRGIGLLSKLKAYNLQDLGHDTLQANIMLRHPADARSYGLATAILLDLGLGGEKGINLLTNNPEKVRAVEGPNREVRVVKRVPMIPIAWRTDGEKGVRGEELDRYLGTKIEKFKHMFTQ